MPASRFAGARIVLTFVRRSLVIERHVETSDFRRRGKSQRNFWGGRRWQGDNGRRHSDRLTTHHHDDAATTAPDSEQPIHGHTPPTPNGNGIRQTVAERCTPFQRSASRADSATFPSFVSGKIPATGNCCRKCHIPRLVVMFLALAGGWVADQNRVAVADVRIVAVA